MVLSGMLLWFTLLLSGLEQPLVQAVHGCCLSVLEAYGRIICSTLPCGRVVRTWKSSGLCLRPCIFQSLVYGCCLWTACGFAGRVRYLDQQWIHVYDSTLVAMDITSHSAVFRWSQKEDAAAWMLWLRDEDGSFEKVSYGGRVLRNASAMTAERGALRMGIPTEVSSFDVQVENSGRTEQYKLNAQSLRLFGLHCDVNDAHRAGANRLQNKETKSSPVPRVTEPLKAAVPSQIGRLVQSSPKASERDCWVDGDDVWVRIDTVKRSVLEKAAGSGTRRGNDGTDGSTDC